MAAISYSVDDEMTAEDECATGESEP